MLGAGGLTLALALGTEVMHLKQTPCLEVCYDNQVCYRWPSRAPARRGMLTPA